MKYLLVVAVVGFMLWLMFGRGRGAGKRPADGADPAAAPVAMVGCAHCDLHLAQTEAVADGGRRWYCSEAHRLAGPR